MQVSPFRYLRIDGYLLLPVAFRSLSRLSSALSAKASTLRSLLLNLFASSVTLLVGLCSHSLFFRVFSLSDRLSSFCLGCLVISRFCKLLILLRFFGIRFSRYKRNCKQLLGRILRILLLENTTYSQWAQVDSNHRPHAYQACALTG